MLNESALIAGGLSAAEYGLYRLHRQYSGGSAGVYMLTVIDTLSRVGRCSHRQLPVPHTLGATRIEAGRSYMAGLFLKTQAVRTVDLSRHSKGVKSLSVAD